MTTRLRPLQTVEILDAAWLLLRRTWAHAYAISTLGTVPVAGFAIGYFIWLGLQVEGTENAEFYTGTLWWAAGMAAAWVLNSLARTAVTALMLADARGQESGWGAAWKSALRHAGTATFVGLFSFAAAAVAGSCVAAPGVFLALAWWVARPVLLDEDRPFAAALRRSWRLTDGYRAKSLGLWLLMVALAIVTVFDLHLLVHFLTGTVAGIFGIDTSGVGMHLQFRNQAYTTFLIALAFVLLDPLKTAADTVLYLDLRIRREGADLAERLRGLSTAAAAVLMLLLIPAPARAMSAKEYAARLKDLRAQVQGAKSPGDVDPVSLGQLRSANVDLSPTEKLEVKNDWLDSGLKEWDKGGREALLHKLEALERTAGAPEPTIKPRTEAVEPAPDVDPKAALQKILAAPEFQPLAERDELRDLAKKIDLGKTRNWWSSFLKWLQDALFKPKAPKVETPNWKWPNLTMPVYILLGLAVLFLLVLIVRWIMERPLPQASSRIVTSGDAPPLENSLTENALEHSVDEWELFAQQWLQRGEVRQAIRALYLATLVHLHRERQIEYNRAFTNWVYVRQFRGQDEQKGILRQLTRTFDEVWYGDRECGESQYRQFETGVRTLGTPAPVTGAARG